MFLLSLFLLEKKSVHHKFSGSPVSKKLARFPTLSRVRFTFLPVSPGEERGLVSRLAAGNQPSFEEEGKTQTQTPVTHQLQWTILLNQINVNNFSDRKIQNKSFIGSWSSAYFVNKIQEYPVDIINAYKVSA